MRFTIIGMVALVVGGCGPESDPNAPRAYELVPAGGRVTLDGKPLAGAVVTFLQTDENGTTCSADTDEDGEYELSYRAEPGAAAAVYKVAISYKVGRNGKPLALGDRINLTRENGGHLAKEQVAPESSNLGKTTLKATIPAAGGRFDFDLRGPLLSVEPIPPLEDKGPAGPPGESEPFKPATPGADATFRRAGPAIR